MSVNIWFPGVAGSMLLHNKLKELNLLHDAHSNRILSIIQNSFHLLLKKYSNVYINFKTLNRDLPLLFGSSLDSLSQSWLDNRLNRFENEKFGKFFQVFTVLAIHCHGQRGHFWLNDAFLDIHHRLREVSILIGFFFRVQAFFHANRFAFLSTTRIVKRINNQ